MKNNKISLFQLFIITFFLTRTYLLSNFYNNILQNSPLDIIISLILTIIIGIIIITIYTILLKKQPHDIITIIETKFPKIFNIIFKVILMIFIIVITSTILKEFSLYVNNNYLENYSPYIISITILISSFYLIRGKIESISRFSEIMFYLFSIFFLLIITNITNGVDISNFKPLVILKDNNILNTTIYMLSNLLIPLFFLTMIPLKKINTTKHYTKTIILGYSLACLTILLTIIMIIGSFGPTLASYYEYPETIILKKITLFTVFDRIDSFLALTWLIDITISLSIMLYTIKRILNNLYNPITILLVTLLVIVININIINIITLLIIISFLTLIAFQLNLTKKSSN